MGRDLVTVGPILPLPVLAAAVLLLALAIWRVCRRQPTVLARYVILAVWVRYVLSALHTFTYREAAAGVTWNALGSALILGVGLLLIDKRLLLHRALAPVYLLVGVVVVSGVLNGQIGGLLNTGLKYGYFIILLIALRQAMADPRTSDILSWLLWAFSPLLLLQLLSILLGVGKASEADGSVSWIGGYNHEAAFSLSLAACFLTACFARDVRPPIRAAILTVSLVGLFLANYRTSMLALAPLAAAQLFQSGTGVVRPEQRPAMAMLAAAAIAGLAMVVVGALGERFSDLAVLARSGFDIIKPPTAFTWEDRDVMSGRPYIWSLYIYAFEDGTSLQRIVGLGPDAWLGRFRVYAHNTLVAYLYELGWAGLVAVVLLWLGMLLQALQAPADKRLKLVAAHASFFLVNMATMPHWMVEGLIFYAILCGYTLHESAVGRRRRAAARAPVRGTLAAAPQPT